jgi:hypothetical protein
MDLRTPSFPPPAQSTPPSFSPSPWNARSDRRDYSFASVAALAIVAIVAACIAMVQGREPLGPSEWDPRVVPLVEFVEETRGHEFAHPVYVEFLTPEQYRAHATEGPADDAYLDTMLRVLRSMGLVGGDIDLSAEVDEINDSGTLASYSPQTRRIYVRGTEMTPSLGLTLVHELTHALQDQTFDLGFSRAQSDGEAFALRALAEGDAIRIEQEFYDTLTDAEQAQVDEQSEVDVGSSKALNSNDASILLSLFGAPYDLGVPFVRLLAAIEGELDEAFRFPPLSEENIFDPVSYFNDDRPERVVPVKVPDGADRITELGNDIGVVMWYLLIATHTDQKQAMTAVDGWQGDAMTVYEQHDRLCTAMIFRAETNQDADEMHIALTQVGAELSPNHQPKISIDARDVRLTVCDPGASAKAPTIDASSIFAAPTLRSYLLGIALDDPDVSVDQADCAVAKTVAVLDDARMAQILEAPTADDPFVQEVLSRLRSAISGCR